MKKKTVYEAAPVRYGKVVPDFLPKPQDLVLRESNIRVTLNLSARSLGYFREMGRKNRIPYQKLIRRLLDEYAAKAA